MACEPKPGSRGPETGSVHAADALAGIIDLGDAPTLQLLRQHHDAEWFVLSLRELREHERVQLSF